MTLNGVLTGIVRVDISTVNSLTVTLTERGPLASEAFAAAQPVINNPRIAKINTYDAGFSTKSYWTA